MRYTLLVSITECTGTLFFTNYLDDVLCTKIEARHSSSMTDSASLSTHFSATENLLQCFFLIPLYPEILLEVY